MPTARYGHAPLGVDYSIPPYELPMGALADAQNVVPTQEGLITGRNGSVKLNGTSLASRVTSFHEFRSGTATRDKVVSYSTKIGVYNSGTGEFVDKITGLTSDKMWQWVNFAGKAIGVNEGNDVPQYWTSDAAKGDLAGAPPTGRTIAEWGNRCWLGGDATDVALLTGCAVNDPTNWTVPTPVTALSAQEIIVGDSEDPIIGLFPFFDILLVGKGNNIYKVTGTTITDATTLTCTPLYSKSQDNVGFTSPWAITQVGNDVIFLDGFDIKRLSGIQEYGDVSYSSIIPHFRQYLEDTCDKDYLQYSQFFHYKKKQQVWVSIPTGASTHFVFVLDYRFLRETGRWAVYPMSGLTANIFGGVENGELTDIYFGDETGYVNQLDTGEDDNGVAITRYFVNFFAGQEIEDGAGLTHTFRKQFYNSESHILPSAAALAMTPSYALDLHNPAQVRTSGNYTDLTAETVTGWDGTGVKFKRVPFFGMSGRSLALKWTHATVGQNFSFYPSTVEYKFKTKNYIT